MIEKYLDILRLNALLPLLCFDLATGDDTIDEGFLSGCLFCFLVRRRSRISSADASGDVDGDSIGDVLRDGRGDKFEKEREREDALMARRDLVLGRDKYLGDSNA